VGVETAPGASAFAPAADPPIVPSRACADPVLPIGTRAARSCTRWRPRRVHPSGADPSPGPACHDVCR